ncbi:hypothetical protein GCM10008171_24490 [Methylopila jiangsuensis]|uniref:Uncharacterized protein n=1 Tax=Methylopila jiangsuensis TaxID=586230 RepID=A0A9W6JJV2_9HYPH|nr:hypothetical protein GCM10008171_24490 [Methylopila jiangsuensis]
MSFARTAAGDRAKRAERQAALRAEMGLIVRDIGAGAAKSLAGAAQNPSFAAFSLARGGGAP